MACEYTLPDGRKFNEKEFKAHLLSGGMDQYAKSSQIDTASFENKKGSPEIEEKRAAELKPLIEELNRLRELISNREERDLDRGIGPIVNRQEAQELIDYLTQKYGIQGVLRDLGDEVFGQFNRRTLRTYINENTRYDKNGNLTSSYTGNLKRRTIFHEYLHPFVQLLMHFNAELFNKIHDEAEIENNNKPYANIKSYPDFQKREELVVRYLTMLSDNDKKPNIFKSFWDWLTSFFYERRKKDAYDLKELKPTTTVKELYEVFKNYGNIKGEFAGMDRMPDIVSALEDVEYGIRRSSLKNSVLPELADKIKELWGLVSSRKDYNEIIYPAILSVEELSNRLHEEGNIGEYENDLLSNLNEAVNDVKDYFSYRLELDEDSIKQRIKELENKVDEINKKYDSLYIDENKNSPKEEPESTKSNSKINESTVSDYTDDPIGDYKLTSSSEVNQFMSGKSWEDIMGEAPEGDQNYYVQKLSDMLQDGKNMINSAMNEWGNDIMEYGPKLFQYIQQMKDSELNNKKAVLLATFLGEIKESQLRNPDRSTEIKPLQNSVFDYYQRFMNVKGKDVVAARLLRFYRDKYMGDLFINKILEEQQVREKEAIERAQRDNRNAPEEAFNTNESITEEEKKKEDKQDKEATETDSKKQQKKKRMSNKEANDLAEQKLKEIQAKAGTQKGLADRIKDLINRINCK